MTSISTLRLRIENMYRLPLVEILAIMLLTATISPTWTQAAEPSRVAERANGVDFIGDPLPEAAIFRFGTKRLQHPSGVVELGLSTDQKTLISMDGDQIIAWETATGKRRWQKEPTEEMLMGGSMRFSAASYGVRAVAFEHLGNRFYASGIDGVSRWDAMTGKFETIPVKNSKNLFQFALSALDVGGNTTNLYKSLDVSKDDKLLALGSHRRLVVCRTDGEIVYEISNRPKKPIRGIEDGDRLLFGGDYSYGRFSNDGTKLAVVLSESPEEIRLVDANSGGEIERIKTTSRVVRFAFSPDSQRIVATERDIAVRLYDVKTGEQQWELVLPQKGQSESYTSAVEFGPHGKVIAVGAPIGADQRIRLLDASSGAEVGSLQGHQWKPWTLVFSDDGKTLYSSGWDGMICGWDIEARQLRDLPAGIRASPTCAASPDGESLAFVDNAKRIHVVDVHDGSTRTTLELPDTSFSQLTFSSNGRLLAGGGSSDQLIHVVVWDLVSRNIIHHWEWPKGNDNHSSVEALDFSRDGERLAAAVFRQSKAYVWELSSDKQLAELKHQEIYSLSFSPDSRTLATVGWDRVIRLWDSGSGQVLNEKLLPRDDNRDERMYGVSFSPLGDTLATSHMSAEVRLWNPEDFTIRKSFSVANGFVYGTLDFSADGMFLAAGDRSGGVEVWDAVSGQRVWDRGKHDHYLYNVSFGSDFRTLMTGGDDEICYLWDLRPKRFAEKSTEDYFDDLVGDDGQAAYAACWALTENPDAAIKVFLEKLAPQPGEAAEIDSAEDSLGKRRAIMLLKHLGASQATGLLLQIKENDPNPELRSLAAAVLDGP